MIPEIGESTVATMYRRYVMNLLDLDTDREEKSPLTKSDYRRALFAILGTDPRPLLIAGHQVTEDEAVAYEYGQQAMLDALFVKLGELWRPHALEASGSTERVPDQR